VEKFTLDNKNPIQGEEPQPSRDGARAMNRIGRRIIYVVLVIVVLLVIWQILAPL
jgi:hypothetical protein